MTRSISAPRRGGLVRNIIHLGIGQVATTFLTILLNAALARTLGPSDFGLLYLLNSTALFAYVIIDWGHGPLIIRETARNPARSGDLMGSALAMRAVGALIGCVAAVVATRLLGYDLRTQLLAGAMILAWLPQYLGLSLGWVFRGMERMDSDAQINVVFKLAALIFSISSLALFGGNLGGLVAASALAGCLTLVVGIAMYRNLNLPRLSATASTARSLLRDGAAIFAMSAAIAVEPFFNANILYKMASPVVVGWYGAAWAIVGTLLAPATVLGAAMYPRLSAVSGDAVEFKRTFDLSFRPITQVAVLGAVGTYLFADVPVELIYTLEGFGPAADNLRASALVMLLMYVDMFLAMVVLALGKAGRLAGAKVASVIICTGLVFFLVPIFQARFGNGGLGAIYAMVIGELLMFITTCVLIREVVDGRTIGNVFRSLIAGAATILVFRLMPGFTPFLAIPMCVLVFGGLSMLVGALKRSDVDLVLATFRKRPPAPAPADQ